ncbi:MAG TPA: hypothetical protein PKC21_08625 [Oligoflexia bacterium]|nr:hypothetical protein [Oligoflexia bacterium]HMR25404.1 hypothetical protein [Oligoflexia bacterium]
MYTLTRITLILCFISTLALSKNQTLRIFKNTAFEQENKKLSQEGNYVLSATAVEERLNKMLLHINTMWEEADVNFQLKFDWDQVIDLDPQVTLTPSQATKEAIQHLSLQYPGDIILILSPDSQSSNMANGSLRAATLYFQPAIYAYYALQSPCDEEEAFIRTEAIVIAHEIAHSYGLTHDLKNKNTLMNESFSKCSKSLLTFSNEALDILSVTTPFIHQSKSIFYDVNFEQLSQLVTTHNQYTDIFEKKVMDSISGLIKLEVDFALKYPQEFSDLEGYFNQLHTVFGPAGVNPILAQHFLRYSKYLAEETLQPGQAVEVINKALIYAPGNSYLLAYKSYRSAQDLANQGELEQAKDLMAEALSYLKLTFENNLEHPAYKSDKNNMEQFLNSLEE